MKTTNKLIKQDWNLLYQNDIKQCLKILNCFDPTQQWTYEIIIDKEINWPVWTFNSKDQILSLWSDDMINFHFNNTKLKQFFIKQNKAFMFDGRLLSQSNDEQLNQAIVNCLKQNFIYNNRFDETFLKLKQIATRVNNKNDLIKQINNYFNLLKTTNKKLNLS